MNCSQITLAFREFKIQAGSQTVYKVQLNGALRETGPRLEAGLFHTQIRLDSAVQ